jgi:hypothetical protein
MYATVTDFGQPIYVDVQLFKDVLLIFLITSI